MPSDISRRGALRGFLNGAAVAVALPVLECMLNDNGTAFAATGKPLPVRFGSWAWGCGVNPERWVPANAGANYDLPAELKAIAAVKDQISILSGFDAALDGRPNTPHKAGIWTLRTGTAPIRGDDVDAPSFDAIIADRIGKTTRFRSLETSSSGNARECYSRQSLNSVGSSEVNPLDLYARLFGADFRDPNAATFSPDPAIMTRRSVLSSIGNERRALMDEVGVADRQRLDDYFTSVRQLENQLDLQLTPPAPAEACIVPKPPSATTVSTLISDVQRTHEIMTKLLVMAVACNQTRVFNMVFSDSASTLRNPGSSQTHHLMTHEEQVDPNLGYQPGAADFIQHSMQAWADFVAAFAEVKEGAGTLLDNMLILAHSDTSCAKVHALDNIPVMLAGKAGGRLKAGIHVRGAGTPITRVGLTAMSAMGALQTSWGTGSMQTNQQISEVLA